MLTISSYIHGGAWRDPTVTQTSFEPTITSLLNNTDHNPVLSSVAAFASLDYRLSAHPLHPQDPTSTPATKFRNARHPDHIIDVKSGLKFLQDKYGFGSNYVLIGHSCGATLALQTVLGSSMVDPAKDLALEPPKGIAGVCGIYNIPLMLETNSHPAYREFVAGAFGDEASLWEKISPSVQVKRDQRCLSRFVVCLAYSLDDELIDEPQVRSLGRGDLLVLKGAHDEIWQSGTELAKVVFNIVTSIS
jgi:acetyl esterase/lipase